MDSNQQLKVDDATSDVETQLPSQNGAGEDPEMDGLSLYEKKALLVNRELDSHGMGKYQWYIFFLCGFGYFLDLMWAQAFGLVASPLQEELGFSTSALGNIFSSFSAGLTAGESPKFLLYRGRDDEAVQVLHNIARFNGRESTITRDVFAALTDENVSTGNHQQVKPTTGTGLNQAEATFTDKVKLELSRYKMLFSGATVARLTILVWITYMFDYWGFSVAGSFLPTILLQKNSAIKVSLRQTYRNYAIIYIWGIPGVMLGALLYQIPRVGRKWAMVGSSALMATSLFLFAAVNTEASNIALNAMEYFFQSMFNAVLYGWTPEAFPAPIRGTASGLASFWGRLISIVAPLIAAHLLATSLNGPLYLAGAGVFVCTVAILFMPTSHMGAQSY
ncbi:membrane transporter [Lasallia pustulata]|uniref:Membrane transporter n=1 Tax=Lasallia pustulata TaxID=136370 RepID=A0A1W5CXB0_9LECA|nr:membrane transporter [Lasallia pustulata]